MNDYTKQYHSIKVEYDIQFTFDVKFYFIIPDRSKYPQIKDEEFHTQCMLGDLDIYLGDIRVNYILSEEVKLFIYDEIIKLKKQIKI